MAETGEKNALEGMEFGAVNDAGRCGGGAVGGRRRVLPGGDVRQPNAQ